MNTAIAPYPRFGKNDFASANPIGVCGINPALQRLNSFENSQPRFASSFGSLKSGIASSVSQNVFGRFGKSADLSPTLRQRITELSTLESNWDGAGAKIIKLPVLADVVQALTLFSQQKNNFREPFLAPIFDGFVQMEWHDKRRSLDIEVTDQGWSLTGTMIGNDGKHVYFTSECERSDFHKLEKFYEWFVGTELIWPSL